MARTGKPPSLPLVRVYLRLSYVVVVRLAKELVEAGEGHEGLDAQEVPAEGVDLEGVLAPNESGNHDDELLRSGQVLCRHLHVSNVGNGNAPLEGRRPEEDSEGTSGTEEPVLEPGCEGQ